MTGFQPPRAIPLPEAAALIRRACAGDRQAIEALIGLYQGRIAKFVVAQTGDGHHYEDLCQMIFVKMVLGLPRLRVVESFEPWLFQIARNLCRDHLRRRRGWRRLFTPYAPAHDSVATLDAPATGDKEQSLKRGIERLPENQQNLLRLWLEGDRSYAELARLSHSSVPAVKSRLHRARENLRGFLSAGESE